jgi:hypothetical protein
LNTWFAGSEAGSAIADVLFGDENPSENWRYFPRSVGQIPIYYSHKNTGRPLGNKKENLKNLSLTMKEMNLYIPLVLDWVTPHLIIQI